MNQNGRLAACAWAAAGAAVGAAATLFIGRRILQSHTRSGKYFAGMIKCKPELMQQYMQLHDHT